jgi:hypothetical protein
VQNHRVADRLAQSEEPTPRRKGARARDERTIASRTGIDAPSPRARPRRNARAQPPRGRGAGPPLVVPVSENCSQANFICQPFLQAIRRTGVSGKIVSPDVREDDVASLPLARQGYDLIVRTPSGKPRLAVVAPRSQGSVCHSRLPALRRSRPAQERTGERVSLRTRRRISPAGLRHEWNSAGRAGTCSRSRRRRPRPASGGLHRRVQGRRAPRGAARERMLVQYSGDFVDPSKCEAIARAARSHAARSDLQRRRGVRTRDAASRATSRSVGHRRGHRPIGSRPRTS